MDGLLTKTVKVDKLVSSKDLSQHSRNYIQEIKHTKSTQYTRIAKNERYAKPINRK